MNKVKAYLLRYARAVETIRQCETDIEQIEAAIETTTLDADGMPRGTSISDKTGRLAVQLADMKLKRETLALNAYIIRERIEDVIRAVPDAQQSRVLYMRYVTCDDWKTIADALGYNEIYVRGRLHSAALTSAEHLIPAEDFGD